MHVNMFEIVAIMTISTKPNLITPNPFACPNILEPYNFFCFDDQPVKGKTPIVAIMTISSKLKEITRQLFYHDESFLFW